MFYWFTLNVRKKRMLITLNNYPWKEWIIFVHELNDFEVNTFGISVYLARLEHVYIITGLIYFLCTIILDNQWQYDRIW